jgi:hypothetical protein
VPLAPRFLLHLSFNFVLKAKGSRWSASVAKPKTALHDPDTNY